MTLSSIRKNLKKLLFFAALLCLVGILVFLFVTLFLNQANPIYGKIKKPTFVNLLSTRTDWLYLNKPIKKTTVAPVFKVTKRGYSQVEAINIAKNLGLSGNPERLCSSGTSCTNSEPNLLIWKQASAQLSIDTVAGKINYKDFAVLEKNTKGEFTDTDKAVEEALKFLHDKGIYVNGIDEGSPTIKMQKASSNIIVDVESLSEANLLEVGFNLKLGGLEVLNNDKTSSVRVKFYVTGKVYSVNLNNTEVNTKNFGTYPTSSTSEIKNSIPKGEGVLAAFPQTGYGSTVITNPKSISVGKGRTALYDDGVGEFIQPILVFDSIVRGSTQQSEATVYLPAVSKDYLKSD